MTGRLRLVSTGIACVILTLGLAASLQAAPKQQQPAGKHQDFSGKGEFDKFGPGYFTAVLDGEQWAIQLDPKAKVKVTGTATADFLAPGMFVRFKGTFVKGKATEEVKDLEIFTPDEKNPVGATSAGNAFDSTPAASKKGASGPTDLDIAGRITGVKKGAYTINCQNATVSAAIAADATIKVEVADMALASPQDRIEVKGWFINKSRGIATEVTVDLANPLTGPKKKGHGAKAADKSAAKPAGKGDVAAADDKKADPDKKADADKKPADPNADPKKPADDATK